MTQNWLARIEQDVLKHHAHVKILHQTVSSFTNLEQDPIRVRGEFLNQLLSIQASQEFAHHQAVQQLVTAMEEQLFWNSQPGEPISNEERENLMRMCEEIRLHIVCGTLFSLGRSNNFSNASPTSWPEIRSSSSPNNICHGQGGVTYSAYGDKTIILIPCIHTAQQAHEALEQLSALYDLTSKQTDWILDLSQLKELTPGFMEMLLSYKHQLSQNNREVLLCWFPQVALCSPYEQSLKELFCLEQLGNYYFSRALIYSLSGQVD